jgi:hypothetical protein
MPAYCVECGNDTTGKEFCDECGAAVLPQAEPRGDAHDAQLKPRPPAFNPAAAIMTNPVPEYNQADGNYLTELGEELGRGAWMAPEIRRGRAVRSSAVVERAPWKLIVGAAVALLIVIAAAVLLGSSIAVVYFLDDDGDDSPEPPVPAARGGLARGGLAARGDDSPELAVSAAPLQAPAHEVDSPPPSPTPADCETECGKHGSCELGQCVCDVGYCGADCRTKSGCEPPPPPPPPPPPAADCVPDCGKHGECEDGQCVCVTGYCGADCRRRCTPPPPPTPPATASCSTEDAGAPSSSSSPRES